MISLSVNRRSSINVGSNIGIPHFFAIVGQINARTVIESLRWRNESEFNPVIRVTLSFDLDIIGRVIIALARRIAPACRQQEAQYWSKEAFHSVENVKADPRMTRRRGLIARVMVELASRDYSTAGHALASSVS